MDIGGYEDYEVFCRVCGEPRDCCICDDDPVGFDEEFFDGDQDEDDEKGMGFGYDPDLGEWFPPEEEVKFWLDLHDVEQPNGSVQKQWSIGHNLDYYPLIFEGEERLGMKREEVTGTMVVKACLAASWDDASVFFATTFAQLVASGEEAEGEDEEVVDN